MLHTWATHLASCSATGCSSVWGSVQVWCNLQTPSCNNAVVPFIFFRMHIAIEIIPKWKLHFVMPFGRCCLQMDEIQDGFVRNRSRVKQLTGLSMECCWRTQSACPVIPFFQYYENIFCSSAVSLRLHLIDCFKQVLLLKARQEQKAQYLVLSPGSPSVFPKLSAPFVIYGSFDLGPYQNSNMRDTAPF